MATPEFILQGFTYSTHVDALRRLFDLRDIQKVLVSVAFATEAGVEKIESHLIRHASCTTVFVGIRNDTTSYQGLVRLHGIVTDLYTVDTGSRTRIFHPKIYLVRAIDRARLVIGSANLTLAGLNNNIEAGMLLDFDLSNMDDKALVDEIERLFSTAVADYPDHVVKVGDVAALDKMLVAGRLADELTIRPDQEISVRVEKCISDSDELDNNNDDLPRIKLKVKSIRSGLAKTSGIQKPHADGSSSSPKANLATIEVNKEFDKRHAAASKIESSRDSSVTHYLKRKAGEGPRLRAARARREARILRKKWYCTGDPCSYGHLSDRLVSNGKCRECNRRDSEHYNKLGIYR